MTWVVIGAPFSAESGQFGSEAYIVCMLDILGNVHLGIDGVMRV